MVIETWEEACCVVTEQTMVTALSLPAAAMGESQQHWQSWGHPWV